jgi:hypothetical protein
MSVDEIEKKLLELSAEERRQFVSWFYGHKTEIEYPADYGPGLSDQEKAKIANRLKEITEHPDTLVPFHIEDFDRFLAGQAEENAKKAAALP